MMHKLDLTQQSMSPSSYFFNLLILVNIGLFVFNLIPIPPLDGSRIFMYFLPDRYYYIIMRYEMLGGIVIMLLLYNGFLNRPLQNAINFCINLIYILFKNNIRL